MGPIACIAQRGFNTHRHALAHDLHGQAKGHVPESGQGRPGLEEERVLRKHLERHHPGVVRHAVDGVIHKEGMHFS